MNLLDAILVSIFMGYLFYRAGKSLSGASAANLTPGNPEGRVSSNPAPANYCELGPLDVIAIEEAAALPPDDDDDEEDDREPVEMARRLR